MNKCEAIASMKDDAYGLMRHMREQASSFDVARIVRSFSMIGARARKAYQPHYEQVVIRLNPKGSPSSDLVIVSGRRLYLLKEIDLCRHNLHNLRWF